jgi:GNAT superfamily N-acetyltransferase
MTLKVRGLFSRVINQKSKGEWRTHLCRKDGSAPKCMNSKLNIKNNSTLVVIPSSADYAEQMQQLQHIVYHSTPEEPDGVLLAEHFRNHVKVFPEGQFIALDTATNTVVGLTVSMRMNFDPNKPFIEPWLVTIGGGWLSTHVPNGEWMYGVESCVHPDYQGMGIGSKLMDARFDVARRLNLKGMVAGSAIIDYYKVPESVSPEDYVQGVVSGKYFDTNLTKQIRKGFKPHCLIPNYLHDPETRGWGVTIVWDNPEYRPGARVTQQIAQLPRYSFNLRPRIAV